MPGTDQTRGTTAGGKKPAEKVTTKVLKWKDLWNAYPTDAIEHIDPKTKKDVFDNHCAINVSAALIKAGVSMKSYKGGLCWHCASGAHVHALAAQELANWLKGRPFPGCPKVQVLTGKNFKDELDDKTGIIFFKDYWQRANEKGTPQRTGDHIDLWDDGTLAGSGALGSFVRITIGFSWDGWMSDHELSKEVLFWEIK